MTAVLTPSITPFVTPSVEPSITVRRRPRVDERTFRRRRAVAGAVAAAVVVLAGVAAHDVLAGPGGVPASAAGAQPAPVEEVRLVARPGDTMWAIAERFHGNVELARYLEALIDRNGGPSLQAGQVVVLP